VFRGGGGDFTGPNSRPRYYAALPRAEAHLDALAAGAATLMELPADQFAS
jgi:hypothetical protein